jgi:hypothetical protein
MEGFIIATEEDPHVVERGLGRRSECYFRNGEMRLREVRGERILDQLVTEALRMDLFERACFFADIDP